MPVIPKLKNKNSSSSGYDRRLWVNRWVSLVLTVPTFWLDDISHLVFQIASYLICKMQTVDFLWVLREMHKVFNLACGIEWTFNNYYQL